MMIYKFLVLLPFCFPIILTARHFDRYQLQPEGGNYQANTMTQAKESEKEASIIEKVWTVYVAACYIIMGFVALTFYRDYKRCVEKAEKIKKAADQPNLENLGDLFQMFINNPQETIKDVGKLRTKESFDQELEKLLIGFILAPFSVPYFVVEGFPEF